MIVLIVWEEVGAPGWLSFLSKVNKNCVQKLAKCSNLAKTRSKIWQTLHYNFDSAAYVACGTLWRQIEAIFIAIFEVLGDI